MIAELKAKTAAIAQAPPRRCPPATTGADRRSDARRGRQRRGAVLSGRARAETAHRPSASESAPAVGDRVIVGGLGLEAIVTSIHDGTADLDVRGKRMRASVRDLRVIGGPAPAPRVNVHVELQPREAGPSDLNVIGCTVDEAIARAERFLDESLLTDQRVVRLIHGYGTGQLKRALAGFLQQHPLVARFATAPPEQGGGGVTVVELKDWEMGWGAGPPYGPIPPAVHRRSAPAGEHRAGRAGVRPAQARRDDHKGLCPFHSEKTPSFHVNPEKGFFHCFGCGVGGDVFKFLELHEKVGFQDAVRMLAQKFGVALPEPAEGDDDARRDSGLREALLKVHEIAAAYFAEQLAAPPARARASS